MAFDQDASQETSNGELKYQKKDTMIRLEYVTALTMFGSNSGEVPINITTENCTISLTFYRYSTFGLMLP